jgi:hypothetical protein
VTNLLEGTPASLAPQTLEGRGIYLQVNNLQPDSAVFNSIIEVQLTDGSWEAVPNWQPQLQPDGNGVWPISDDQVNGSLYRWVIFDGSQSSERLGISEPFILPQASDEQLEVTIELE